MAKDKFDIKKPHANSGDDKPQDHTIPDPSPPASDPPPFARIQGEFSGAEDGDELVSPDAPPPDPVAAEKKIRYLEIKMENTPVAKPSTSNDAEYRYVSVRRYFPVVLGLILIAILVVVLMFGLPGAGNISGLKSNSSAGGASAPEPTAKPTERPITLTGVDVWEHASVGCVDDLTAEMQIVCIQNNGDSPLVAEEFEIPPGGEWCQPASLTIFDDGGANADPEPTKRPPVTLAQFAINGNSASTNGAPDVAGLFKDTASGESYPDIASNFRETAEGETRVIGVVFDPLRPDDLLLVRPSDPGSGEGLVVGLMFMVNGLPPVCDPVSLPPPVTTEEPTEEPPDSSVPVSTEEPTDELGDEPSPVCGDLVCDPNTENTDLCPTDCQCVDDGVCRPGEGDSCQDCGASAGFCGATCVDSSQCAEGLACAGGVCWDTATCGSDPGGNSGGGSGGSGGGGSCGYGECGCQAGIKEDFDEDSGCTTYFDSCGNSIEKCGG